MQEFKDAKRTSQPAQQLVQRYEAQESVGFFRMMAHEMLK